MKRRRRKKEEIIIDEVYKNEVLFYTKKLFLNFDLKSKLLDAYEANNILNFLGVEIEEIDEYFNIKLTSNKTLLDKNIANVFKEAKNKKVVLIFD